MNRIPKVSIIIACYNDPDVVKAVKSAYEQSYNNKEIIVIDDGSNPLTVKAISSVMGFIDILLTQNNMGQSTARNYGISKASGEYILNHDSDDFFETTFCAKAIKRFNEDPEISIVTCLARRFNKQGMIDIFTPKGGNLNNFLFANSALGSSMFKRSDWERVGGYEEQLPILGIEDWEFYISILRAGGYAYVIDEPLFNYQIRENSTTAKIKTLKHDKFKNIILKHEELYHESFDKLITYYTEKLKSLEREKNKNLGSLEFRIGRLLLKPFRFLKSIIK